VSLDITPGIRQLISFPPNRYIISDIVSYIIANIIRWAFMFQLHRNINAHAIRYLNRYII
jgi:hypothetical protein